MLAAAFRDYPVTPDFNILEAQAEIAGLRMHAPFSVNFHPTEVGRSTFI
jgi:hypothetical protein